jgi:hypothetical protein
MCAHVCVSLLASFPLLITPLDDEGSILTTWPTSNHLTKAPPLNTALLIPHSGMKHQPEFCWNKPSIFADNRFWFPSNLARLTPSSSHGLPLDSKLWEIEAIFAFFIFCVLVPSSGPGIRWMLLILVVKWSPISAAKSRKTLIVSSSFCGSEIWEWLSCVVLAWGLWQDCNPVIWGCGLICRLDWRIHFQDGAPIWLLTRRLSSLPCGFPHKTAWVSSGHGSWLPLKEEWSKGEGQCDNCSHFEDLKSESMLCYFPNILWSHK